MNGARLELEHPGHFAGRVALTGGTGYVGGRLAPVLLERGCTIRALARDPAKLRARPWAGAPGVEPVACDLRDEDAVARACAGCRVAYYLVHSMLSAGPDYRARDAALARTFARGAQRAGVERIIYLGGLGEMGANLSEHLTSRREVEAALASTPVPVTTLRAAMIIGAGSASFEIMRYLVERLPVMVTPRWVSTECQPIAIQNVLHYLAACLDTPDTTGRTLDIGGAEVLTYREIMQLLARELGLPPRVIVPVPVLTPRLSSLWIHLVTPVSHRIARPLAEGLRNRVVCRDDEAQRRMPQRLLTVREALAAALAQRGAHSVSTAWFDAGTMPGDPDWAGGSLYADRRAAAVRAPAATVFRAVCRIGGDHGYYAADWLWRLRGALDRLAGGPGLRRGRRHPEQVGYGEALDFWRVIAVEPERRLVLRAEMRLPGVAELEFCIEPVGAAPMPVRLVQTARFKPRGLAGVLYWYAVAPLHGPVFRGMLRGICAAAEAGSRSGAADPAAGAPRGADSPGGRLE